MRYALVNKRRHQTDLSWPAATFGLQAANFCLAQTSTVQRSTIQSPDPPKAAGLLRRRRYQDRRLSRSMACLDQALSAR